MFIHIFLGDAALAGLRDHPFPFQDQVVQLALNALVALGHGASLPAEAVHVFGDLPDKSAVYGVISRLSSLGVTLVSVCCQEDRNTVSLDPFP